MPAESYSGLSDYLARKNAEEQYNAGNRPPSAIEDINRTMRAKYDPAGMEAFATIAYPLMGIMETIGTKGKSPGTQSMRLQDIEMQNIEKMRARDEAERLRLEEARERALAKRLYGEMGAEDIGTAEGVRNVAQQLLAAGRVEEAADYLKMSAEMAKPKEEITPQLETWILSTYKDQPEVAQNLLNDPKMAKAFFNKYAISEPQETFEDRLKRIEAEAAARGRGMMPYNPAFVNDPSLKPPTESQAAYATYSIRMKQAEDVFNKLNVKGFDPAALKVALTKANGMNLIRDPLTRQYAQAMRSWINASLRRESGAVIADSEFDNAYRQYFAEFGDDPVTLEQKRNNRLAQFSSFKAVAGPHYDAAMKVLSEEVTNQRMDFATAQEAEAASNAGRIPKGTKVFVGGKHVATQD